MKSEQHICDITCKYYNSLGCPYSGVKESINGKPCDEYRRRNTCLNCKAVFDSDCYKECKFFGILTDIEPCDLFEKRG